MVQIHAFVFLLILQALLVVGGLAAYWFYKSRRPAADAPPATAAATTTPPDLSAYLTAELKVCETQRAATKQEADALDWLGLRIAWLRLEQTWISKKDRDAAFWQEVEQQVRALVPPAAPVVAVNSADRAEPVDVTRLIKEQDQTIGVLLEQIIHDVTDVEKQKQLVTRIEQLARTNRELSFCVAILDDENKFLRDQVKALVT